VASKADVLFQHIEYLVNDVKQALVCMEINECKIDPLAFILTVFYVPMET